MLKAIKKMWERVRARDRRALEEAIDNLLEVAAGYQRAIARRMPPDEARKAIEGAEWMERELAERRQSRKQVPA